MKTIVIPTDFTTQGIQVAEAAIRNVDDEVRLLFTHLFHVADDIQNLLFSGYREKEYEMVPDSFWEECKVLKNLNPGKINSIRIDFFYGNKLAGFKNFLAFHKTDFIAYSAGYGIPKLTKNSIDALPVLLKCGARLMNTDVVQEESLSGI